MDRAHGAYGAQDELAVPRSPNGERPCAGGSTGWLKHRVDVTGQPAGGPGCEMLSAVARTAGIFADWNFGDEHRVISGVHHADARYGSPRGRVLSRFDVFCRRSEPGHDDEPRVGGPAGTCHSG